MKRQIILRGIFGIPVGITIGYLIAIVILAGIREKTADNDVPVPFKGSPIVMITACLMAIAFYGFANLAI